MTPGARVAAAIEVLGRWRDTGEGADRLLTRWGRAHRFAGSGDRQAIGDLVYDALRRLRSAQVAAGAGDPGGDLSRLSPRAALIGTLALDGQDPAGLFTGEGHAPAPLDAEERAALDRLAVQGPPDMPAAVRANLPDWLHEALRDLPEAALAVLGTRAPLDLRVNRLRTTPAAAAARLAEEGIGTVTGPLSPDCLRVTGGARLLARSRAYREGDVEIQDAASQAAAGFAGAEPGMTVLDFCAGGGGKTLALAAAMAGRGTLLAHDVSAARMAGLGERAARAGARVRVLAPGATEPLVGRCDLVVVDAPCSGSGAWRRNPDARWRLTPVRLGDLTRLQDEVLGAAARAVRPGGVLAYVTCSMLEAENGARVGRFLAERPGWREDGPRLALLPGPEAGDGFFAARLRAPG